MMLESQDTGGVQNHKKCNGDQITSDVRVCKITKNVMMLELHDTGGVQNHKQCNDARITRLSRCSKSQEM